MPYLIDALFPHILLGPCSQSPEWAGAITDEVGVDCTLIEIIRQHSLSSKATMRRLLPSAPRFVFLCVSPIIFGPDNGIFLEIC
jgi:hypothetical protein